MELYVACSFVKRSEYVLNGFKPSSKGKNTVVVKRRMKIVLCHFFQKGDCASTAAGRE